jgi:type IV fimbrial biogenesis protein FimT
MSGRGNKGFTMMEMLTVLAIVGVLGAMAFPSFKATLVNSHESALTDDMVHTLSVARALAITSHSDVFVYQGAGSSSSDTSMVSAGDWAPGWRTVTANGTGTLAVNSQLVQKGDMDGIKMTVSSTAAGGAVALTGGALTGGGSSLAGLGFDSYGRLITTSGTVTSGATVTVCSTVLTSVNGRSIGISVLGRITTTTVSNPSC